jgi:hypothetical protein
MKLDIRGHRALTKASMGHIEHGFVRAERESGADSGEQKGRRGK